jgi:hypothetical protein
MVERVMDPTTGAPANATLDDYQLPTISDTPAMIVEFIELADVDAGKSGAKARRAADHPYGGSDRQRVRARNRREAARDPAHARPRARGALITPGCARPDTLQGAYELLATPGALPMFGGTDSMGQIDRGIVARDDRGPAAARARHDRGAR